MTVKLEVVSDSDIYEILNALNAVIKKGTRLRQMGLNEDLDDTLSDAIYSALEAKNEIELLLDAEASVVRP